MKATSRNRRRVAVVTGSRAEYGLLKSCMTAIARHSRLELQLVAAGMHLLRKSGFTVRDIERDGWSIDARIRMQRGDDSSTDQAEGLACGVTGMARFFEESATDIVVVLGDRIEAMAAALAATSVAKILAHIHGGDVAPGDADGRMRDAITKLAHVHFAASKSAARRIVRMGEEPKRVFEVGAPGLDRLAALARGRRPKRSGMCLVLQHPCGRAAATEREVMNNILAAVDASHLRPVIVYPNTDRGHSGIVKAIEEYQTRHAENGAVFFRSMNHDDYLRTLIDAEVIVGNSSSGVIEAASARTPAVNVGDRQQGRERSGRSVVDAGESSRSIARAIQTALRRRPRWGAPTVYGDGRGGVQLAETLATLPLDDRFRRKCVVR
ncbi:MAG: UDP-N-acetylglucosamine 2-epimerase [Planctomycetota bacterium]